TRRVPAVWDIADAFGRPALVSGWWTSWPPTAPNSIFYDMPVNETTSAVYPVVIFRRILAKTWNDHRVTINLYNDQRQHRQDPQLMMVSYEGTDAVNH